MDFELDDDKRALQDTARGIIDKECTLAFVRSVIDDGADPSGWWNTMVGLYWPALAIEEQYGGLGLGWMELAILLEELGRAVDPSPYLATTTQFAAAVRNCGAAAQAEQWLGAVAAGSITGALALGAATVTATVTQAGWRLDGTAADVVDGSRAGEIAVVATTPDGVGVFVVNRAAAGAALTTDRIPAYDYTQHIAQVRLDGVVVGADRRLAGAYVAGGVERTSAGPSRRWGPASGSSNSRSPT